jgi:hypothetical protein
MGKALLALSFAAGLGMLCGHAANAVPADAQAVREAAKASSPFEGSIRRTQDALWCGEMLSHLRRRPVPLPPLLLIPALLQLSP